jgi:hypothetical protein
VSGSPSIDDKSEADAHHGDPSASDAVMRENRLLESVAGEMPARVDGRELAFLFLREFPYNDSYIDGGEHGLCTVRNVR